ncbi:MAG: FadR/GntR family transcriptional regulator [Candidatus Promineifilaceae bacterium]|jgi:DNA-binding FadR family transcriptional regulator
MKQKQQSSKTLVKLTLADQVVDSIRESILDGEWQPGEALPTEPELSEIFGVSRAVVRDATRMLAAQGLVEARHGKGVFVTESQTAAFGDALLLALRREGATVWDVEHFEQILYPEIIALATKEASEEELDLIRQAVAGYLNVVRETHERGNQETDNPTYAEEQLRQAYQRLISTMFRVSHNKVIQLLAEPLLRLRNVRSWRVEGDTPMRAYEMEKAFFETIVAAISTGDPDEARETLKRLMSLPAEAEAAMRRTQIGDVPVIELD